MFVFQNFDEVFDFDPDCSYDEYAVRGIEGNRKKLEGLFVDTLLKNFEIRRRELSRTIEMVGTSFTNLTSSC